MLLNVYYICYNKEGYLNLKNKNKKIRPRLISWSFIIYIITLHIFNNILINNILKVNI